MLGGERGLGLMDDRVTANCLFEPKLIGPPRSNASFNFDFGSSSVSCSGFGFALALLALALSLYILRLLLRPTLGSCR